MAGIRGGANLEQNIYAIESYRTLQIYRILRILQIHRNLPIVELRLGWQSRLLGRKRLFAVLEKVVVTFVVMVRYMYIS